MKLEGIKFWKKNTSSDKKSSSKEIKIKEHFNQLYEIILDMELPNTKGLKDIIKFFKNLTVDYYNANHEAVIDNLINELLLVILLSNTKANDTDKKTLQGAVKSLAESLKAIPGELHEPEQEKEVKLSKLLIQQEEEVQ